MCIASPLVNISYLGMLESTSLYSWITAALHMHLTRMHPLDLLVIVATLMHVDTFLTLSPRISRAFLTSSLFLALQFVVAVGVLMILRWGIAVLFSSLLALVVLLAGLLVCVVPVAGLRAVPSCFVIVLLFQAQLLAPLALVVGLPHLVRFDCS